jgi:hypothetical protein
MNTYSECIEKLKVYINDYMYRDGDSLFSKERKLSYRPGRRRRLYRSTISTSSVKRSSFNG